MLHFALLRNFLTDCLSENKVNNHDQTASVLPEHVPEAFQHALLGLSLVFLLPSVLLLLLLLPCLLFVFLLLLFGAISAVDQGFFGAG